MNRQEQKEIMKNRIIGCILCGALGDASGSRFEGQPPKDRTPDTTSFNCTDDTFLTLATIESMIEEKRVNPVHIAQKYLTYYQAGKLPGTGASTLHALQGLEKGGHWAVVGRKGEYAAGNGAAIRIAPLAFIIDPTDYFDRKMIRDVSWITHHNDEAYAGALALTLAIHMAWTGKWAQEATLASLIVEELPDSLVRDKIADIRHTGKELRTVLQERGTTGSAFESVPAAIISAEYAKQLSIVEILEEILSAGGDADSIASMFGQIYGARYGIGEVAQEFISEIPGIKDLSHLAENFAQLITEEIKSTI